MAQVFYFGKGSKGKGHKVLGESKIEIDNKDLMKELKFKSKPKITYVESVAKKMRKL